MIFVLKIVFYYKNLELGGLKRGDGNSKYFHSLIEDVKRVKTEVKSHFEYCFEEPIHNRPTLGGINYKQISVEENVSLIAPFIEEEIKNVV